MSEAAERPEHSRDPVEPRDAARTPEEHGAPAADPGPEPSGAEDARTKGPGAEDARSASETAGTRPSEPAASGSASQPDADAWETACAEDLAAERARRRAQHGPPPGSAAEELRRLLDAVADRISGLSSGAAPLFGMAAQGAAQQMVQQVVRQAKAAVEPVIERNPNVFDHLAAAGTELLAAYRSAVSAQEQRWTRTTPAGRPGTEPAADAAEDHADPSGPQDHRRHGDGRDHPDDGPGPGEHIDLD
ncbi:DUF5304 domain-containing protein [Streptomyces odontomachi]|uniref:DUF5304 domain-containing protein n=1 Tax=Streptomyces odontomachi TaxID=2944940 RepID=UPI002108B1FD|nr:DUF5304 domain-containing protein [Streptomyces sp. ODS25]